MSIHWNYVHLTGVLKCGPIENENTLLTAHILLRRAALIGVNDSLKENNWTARVRGFLMLVVECEDTVFIQVFIF